MGIGKKIINSPETCVDDMLRGIQNTFPSLIVDISSRIIMVNKGKQPNRVGLLSGGGSGHEPFCGGYVGEGMLTAAVAGSVFASPPPAHVLTAIKNVAANCTGGVLVLIMNYTGDVLNFGLAVEMARNLGYNVKSVIVSDDCAKLQSGNRSKRGMSGSLFTFKIAGAMADEGHSLDEIVSACGEVSKNLATLGVCTAPCSLPGAGPLFSLAEDEMELGVGMHGEAGTAKIKMCTASEIVETLLTEITSAINLVSNDKVCVLVNNLGGTSQLEQFVVAGEVHKQLGKRNIKVKRMYVGHFMTSLEMCGIQICVLRIPENSNWLQYIDAPANTIAWPAKPLSLPVNESHSVIHTEEKSVQLTGHEFSDKEAALMKQCLLAAARSLQANEEKLNELDSGCGDGDCGSTLRRLGDAIVNNIEQLPLNHPVTCLIKLAHCAEQVMGGTSGAVYSLMFVGASLNAPNWMAAWESGLDMVMKYSSARLGHRTMLDALIPACETFKQVQSKGGTWEEALESALKEAEKGCENTRNLKPLSGRAMYVEAANIKDVDAGAYGVVVWLKAVASELKNSKT